ncbi:predicted protein [Uncinocarpus reesii 1704]|uniref:Mtf2-like C-terminal domain-containing protein n=1 Tax=Uncinocarpus reesii (strain UAMH 1704) TaxID=336963 RepID=C4JSM4_UNCRE|nr:uncharacterized protein UREG_05463 [Uncinocarpus reesii 1704]EEP80621.1 predicted protein [Uncinocarpus reesii 1704]
MRRAIPSRFTNICNDGIFLPFLYNTRTITAPLQCSRFFPSQARCSRRACCYSTSSLADGKSIPQPKAVAEPEDPPSYLKHRASKLTRRKTKTSRPGSTLTAAEREIFSRLQELNEESEPALSKSEGSVQPFSQKQVLDRLLNDQETAEITSIFSSVVKDLDKPSPRVIPAENIESNVENAEQLAASITPNPDSHEQGPPQFSKVYSKLHAFRDSPSSEENMDIVGIEPFPLAKLIAKRESKKICQELDDAVTAGKGDVGVWQVCEEKVFGMLGMLDRERIASLPEFKDKVRRRGRHTRGRKSSQGNGDVDGISASRVPIDGDKPLDIPENVPTVAVVLKAYPTTLLHAVKVFHRHFPTSQYSTQLFETVKAHGRVSLVMGASAGLCNELISFRWRVYNDLPYVVKVLEEMEEVGVRFNWDTLSIVDEIRKQRQVDKGNTGQKDGIAENGTWWWDSEATRSSYKNLVGWGRGKVGWITRIRGHLRHEEKRDKKLEEWSRRAA